MKSGHWDFRHTAMQSIWKVCRNSLQMIQAVLGGIGAVSLLVAAIGIANTMMMSIYERTKEIGVIKVLGCSLKNIRQMFLLEAGFIGLIRGRDRKYLKSYDVIRGQ